ncbi:DoxX family protein [Corynebacterium pacaense]|uniref:DoxX family protein n=1 Tax=Corynebacterium pacaense TaxID=1816684 RepID=UPI0009BACDB0|nr:DoxX family protein [Corynebacterium pacaense]
MIRKIARPMLASVYIVDGADTVLNTRSHVEGTEVVLDRVRYVLPRKYARRITSDPELVTRIIGGTKIAAGSLLAIGRVPRTSAAALAVVTVPTILARNAFWETQDAAEKSNRRNGFVTNIALLGGLFITTVDTEGKPGVKWRASNAAKRSRKQIQQALPTRSETEKLGDRATDWLSEASNLVSGYTHTAQDYVGDNKDDWLKNAQEAARKASDVVSDYAHKATDTVSDYATKAQSYLDDNAGDWLDAAQANAKTAKKSVVRAAAKAQDRASDALEKAEATSGRAAKKADKRYSKLQAEADKALDRAQKKLRNYSF